MKFAYGGTLSAALRGADIEHCGSDRYCSDLVIGARAVPGPASGDRDLGAHIAGYALPGSDLLGASGMVAGLQFAPMATTEPDTLRDEGGPISGPVYDGFISYSHSADDLLAPRLQSGLQRFAKPWWKRRALRIFRDNASLAANPHLWEAITDAIDQTGWLRGTSASRGSVSSAPLCSNELFTECS